MDDDLVMERKRKNQRFRLLEEERRQERLRKVLLGNSATTNIKETTITTTTTAPNDNEQKSKGLVAPNANSDVVVKPSQQPNHRTNSSSRGVSFSEECYPLPKGMSNYVRSTSWMMSSPSSSVTMSQPTPPQKDQRQQKQIHLIPSNVRHSSDTTSNHSSNHSKPPSRKKISTLLDSSSDEEDTNQLHKYLKECAQRSEDRKGMEQPIVHRKSRSPTAKRKLISFHNNNSDDDDNDTEDILAIAQRIDAKKRDRCSSPTTSSHKPLSNSLDSSLVNTRTINPTPHRQPRNPFTLMKEEDMYYEKINQQNRSPTRKTIVVASKNTIRTESHNNLLWSDSSEDDADNQGSNSSTKKQKSKDLQSRTNTKKRKSLYTVLNTTTTDKDDDENDVIEDDAVNHRLHPHFDHPKFGPYDPPVPFVLQGSVNNNDHIDFFGSSNNDEKDQQQQYFQVPASINRYLPDYQRTGIEFMYQCGIECKGGAILGDDMGLGKTVQTISLLAALYRKTGTDYDLYELKRRRKLVESRIEDTRRETEQALMEGRIHRSDGMTSDFLKELALPEWSPVLVIAPNAVVTNWVEDFKTWAHFSVAVYQGAERASALERIENGLAEVLICGDSTIQGVGSFNALDSAKVKWKLIVVDEFHKFKNEIKHLATNLRSMRDRHGCVVLGLTGTLMQNNHKELWNLVDIVAKDFLGPWVQFEDEYAKSIQLSRTKDASAEAVELGDRKAVELSTKLQRVYLRRTKEDTLADVLPSKDERIIFCELSTLQKELYKYIIEQPDYIVLRHKNAPCDCGVNRKFFLEYQHLRSKEDRIEYQRKNRDRITTRGQCCYKLPKAADGSGVDPDAVLWRQQHLDNEPCSKCPSCTLFGAMSILYKLCSHAALLQVKTPPERLVLGSAQHTEALRQLERAKCFIPTHLLPDLPGGYYFENSIMDNHAGLSGKMAVLDRLLQAIRTQQGRVLLFAHSTKTLDLIESYIQSMGMYSYLRMDGQTANAKRKVIADKFRASSETFIFLLSTKAMGLGLNLTQANFVIMFDVDWNPSSDSQAQDRAYRIGQERNVKVFRLVARGTIEEQKYLRQVYKTQLKSETIVDVKNLDRRKSSRLFRGVAGDENRKGELFGSENLLKFKDGTFMNYASRMLESRRYGVGVYDTNDLLDSVKDLSEEELDGIGQDGNMFGDIAKCTQANDSECDEEVNLGGMSQAMMEVCEQVDGTCSATIHQTTTQEVIKEETELEIEMERSDKTQSPLYDALVGPDSKEWNNKKPILENIESELARNSPISNNALKKSTMRNTKVAGKTSDQIRRGESGPTTFKVTDLFIPRDK